MQRQEANEQSYQRKCIFNPMPDGRGSVYSRKTYRAKNLLRYADSGTYVSHLVPIWDYPLGSCESGYYTIENGKPREVLRSSTYTQRRRYYFQKIHTRPQDVSSRLVRQIYNAALKNDDRFVYTIGPHAGQEVAHNIMIRVVNPSCHEKNIENDESKNNRYSVVTGEGHVFPVATRRNLRQRPYFVQRRKEKLYSKKVKELQENQQRRHKKEEIRKQPREELDFIDREEKRIPNYTENTEENFDFYEEYSDNSIGDEKIAPLLTEKTPEQERVSATFAAAEVKDDESTQISDEERQEPTIPVKPRVFLGFASKNRVVKDDDDDEEKNTQSNLATAQNESTQISDEERQEPTIPVKPRVFLGFASKNRVVKDDDEKKNTQPHLATVQNDFFRQRQKTLEELQALKVNAIEMSKEIEQNKKQTTIINSAKVGLKERLKKLYKKTGSSKSKNSGPRPIEKKSTSQSTLFFPNNAGIRKNTNTPVELKKRLAAMNRNPRR